MQRSLVNKNQQFAACVEHLRRFPYEVALKKMTSINERLVGVQILIQDIDDAVGKLDREARNFTFDTQVLNWKFQP